MDDSKHKEHSQDIILVRNIDVNCQEVTYSTIGRTVKRVDEDTKAEYTDYLTVPEEYNHSEYFMVKWGGQPMKIAPGQTKLLPRYIAEHYAKHLADHVLGLREIAEKRVGLIQSPVERPKTLKEILVSVQTWFNDMGEVDEGLKIAEEVEKLNEGVNLSETDMGLVRNPTVGRLVQESKPLDEILAEAEKVDEGEVKAGEPTRAQLIEELHKMGEIVTGKETKAILQQKLRGYQ